MFHCFKLVQFDYSGSSSGFPGTTPQWIILVSSMWVWWSFVTNMVVSLNNLWMSVSHQSPPILRLMYIYEQYNIITNTSHVLLQSVTRNWLIVYFSSALVLKFFFMLMLLIECYRRNFSLNYFVAEKIRIILCVRFRILIAQCIDRWGYPYFWKMCHLCLQGKSFRAVVQFLFPLMASDRCLWKWSKQPSIPTLQWGILVDLFL